jgi:hypothetical protein
MTSQKNVANLQSGLRSLPRLEIPPMGLSTSHLAESCAGRPSILI